MSPECLEECHWYLDWCWILILRARLSPQAVTQRSNYKWPIFHVMNLCNFWWAILSSDRSWCNHTKQLGPVVQSVVSLTSSLRVISLTVLADSIHNILIFFAEKMWVAFALQKLLTFFSKKFQHICISLDVNFNKSLTNDIVSFEQLGPVFLTNANKHWKASSDLIYSSLQQYKSKLLIILVRVNDVKL